MFPIVELGDKFIIGYLIEKRAFIGRFPSLKPNRQGIKTGRGKQTTADTSARGNRFMNKSVTS